MKCDCVPNERKYERQCCVVDVTIAQIYLFSIGVLSNRFSSQFSLSARQEQEVNPAPKELGLPCPLRNRRLLVDCLTYYLQPIAITLPKRLVALTVRVTCIPQCAVREV